MRRRLTRLSATVLGTAVAVGCAVTGAPTLALAADTAFAASGITTDPAPDASGVVAANRPRVVATFNRSLGAGSSLTLVLADEDEQLCGATHLSGSSMYCVPTADLARGETFTAVGHGVDSTGRAADTETLEFTVTYPALTASYPADGGGIVDGAEQLSATYDTRIGDSSTFRVFTRNPDGTAGDAVSGTKAFSSTSAGLLGGGPSDGMTWTPGTALPAGEYLAVLHAVGVDASGLSNPAARADAVLDFAVTSAAPGDLGAPEFVNNTNNHAVPFTGSGPGGATVTVTVHGETSDALGQPTPGSAGGSVQVPPCPEMSACPWTASVDVGSLHDGSVTWSAAAADGRGRVTPDAAGPATTIDTSAPPPPTVTIGAMTVGSTSVSVQATDTATDIAAYRVQVDDLDQHSVTSDITSGPTLAATPVDVTPLSDGMLTVQVAALDTHGNVSGPAIGTTTKRTGFEVNFPGGTLAVGDALVDFPAAVGRPVGRPALVSVAFTQPVKESWQDNGSHPLGDGPTYRSSLCVRLVGGSGTCVNEPAVVPNSDDRSLAAALPETLDDGAYAIDYVVWPEHFCNSVDFSPLGSTQSADCVATTGTVELPGGSQPFVLTVDGTAPGIRFDRDGVTDPLTKDNIDRVRLSGRADADTRRVEVEIRSSGGGRVRLAKRIRPPADPETSTVGWRFRGVDLSKLRDGRVRFVARAVDAAGNPTPDDRLATYTTRLRLHASHLTETVSAGRVTAGLPVGVRGRLVDQNGNPIGGATVDVQARYGKDAAGSAHHATTDSDGRWHTRFHPQHNVTFWASYAGHPTAPVHDPAATHSASTLVRVAIRFTSPKDGSRVATPVTLTGKVSPNKKGEKVAIYRHTRAGDRLLGRAVVGEDSTWTLEVRLKHRRTTVLVARLGRTAGNIGNRSRYLTLTVR